MDSKSLSNQWLLAFTPNTASFGKDIFEGFKEIRIDGSGYGSGKLPVVRGGG
jgi:hypothetical protein